MGENSILVFVILFTCSIAQDEVFFLLFTKKKKKKRPGCTKDLDPVNYTGRRRRYCREGPRPPQYNEYRNKVSHTN